MIPQVELIERWENVPRVLDAMTEHERQKHWDMSVWGRITECGTVHCAAGRCGLDPWFRDRGFKFDFDPNGEPQISNVMPFFGAEGSSRIFLDSSRRPVETVIEEVRNYTLELQKIAALMAAPGLPAVGDPWPEQGGIYAGARVGRDGAPDYFLIVGPEYDGALTWNRAIDWAAGITVDGHSDFRLPLRIEQSSLFDRVRQLFQPMFYWSGEQHASGSGYAWSQDFAYGNQYDWYKGSYCRARVVRSLIIR